MFDRVEAWALRRDKRFPAVITRPGPGCTRRPRAPRPRSWRATGCSWSTAGRGIPSGGRCPARQHGRARWAAGCGVDDRCVRGGRGRHLRRGVGSGRRPRRDVRRAGRRRGRRRARTVRGRAARAARSVVDGRCRVARRCCRRGRGVPPHVRAGDARRLTARARSAPRCSLRSAAGPPKRRCACTSAPACGMGSTPAAGCSRARDLDVHVEEKSFARARAGGMTRTGCVWCPDWPVIAARRRDDALRDVPVVVRERVGSRDVVRAASGEARADGVTRGMADGKPKPGARVWRASTPTKRTKRGRSRSWRARSRCSRRGSCSNGRDAATSRPAARLATSAATNRSPKRSATRSPMHWVPTAPTCGSGSPTACSPHALPRAGNPSCRREDRRRSSRRGQCRRSATTSSRAC